MNVVKPEHLGKITVNAECFCLFKKRVFFGCGNYYLFKTSVCKRFQRLFRSVKQFKVSPRTIIIRPFVRQRVVIRNIKIKARSAVTFFYRKRKYFFVLFFRFFAHAVTFEQRVQTVHAYSDIVEQCSVKIPYNIIVFHLLYPFLGIVYHIRCIFATCSTNRKNFFRIQIS